MIPVQRIRAPLDQPEAEALSALHTLAFKASGRGWSATEIAVLAEAPGAILLTAGRAEAPRGFAMARIAADEAELLTIATAPDARRQGVAAALLQTLIPVLRSFSVLTVFLEVGVSNAAAVALYEKTGFKRTARRAGYYRISENDREDALIYKMEII